MRRTQRQDNDMLHECYKVINAMAGWQRHVWRRDGAPGLVAQDVTKIRPYLYRAHPDVKAMQKAQRGE